MKHLRSRLTYANVVSSIALFLVLSGATALAATHLGRNSVGTRQLKNNAVSAAKLRKNAVTAAQVKNGSLLGSDINLGSLGTVPSAASVAGRMPFNFFMGPGLRDIATIGPLKLTAKCTITPGGIDLAEVQLFTAVDGAAMDANDAGDEFDVFNVNDSPVRVTSSEVSSGNPDIESDFGDLGALAPDGTAIATEDLFVGINLARHPGQCFFGGTVVKLG